MNDDPITEKLLLANRWFLLQNNKDRGEKSFQKSLYNGSGIPIFKLVVVIGEGYFHVILDGKRLPNVNTMQRLEDLMYLLGRINHDRI